MAKGRNWTSSIELKAQFVITALNYSNVRCLPDTHLANLNMKMIHDRIEEQHKKAELDIMQDLKRKIYFNFVFLHVNKLESNNVFKKEPWYPTLGSHIRNSVARTGTLQGAES